MGVYLNKAVKKKKMTQIFFESLKLCVKRIFSVGAGTSPG